MKVIEGQECFSCREAAAMLGVSNQTIWRYADSRQRPNRRMKSYLHGNKYYIPKSEIIRFRDEIRPTFGGGPGRPMGSKNRRPHDRLVGRPAQPIGKPKTRKTKEQHIYDLLRQANEMMDEMD